MSVLLLSMNCFAEENQGTSKLEETKLKTEAKTLAPIEEGKQYIPLMILPSPDKELIEFFSFNSPSCFKFEIESHGYQTISKTLPEGIKFKRYHLENFGKLSMELAQAWAVANVLGIEDKVYDELYTAIQKNKSVKTADDIKTVFANLGINAETYDKTKNGFLVKAFMAQQTDAINSLQPKYIPSFFVNRKFFINLSELDNTNTESIINDYIRIIAYLDQLETKTEPAIPEVQPEVIPEKK